MLFLRPNIFYLPVFYWVLTLMSSCSSREASHSTITVSDTSSINKLIRKAISYQETNYDSMLLFSDSVIKLSRALNYKEGEARAMSVEADYQRKKGNYARTVELCLAVINLYDSLGLWQEQVRAQNVLSNTYKEMGGEKGTLEYLAKGLELTREAQSISEKKKYHKGIVMSLNQEGIILRDLSKRTPRKDLMDSALLLYQRAITIIEQTGEGEADLGKLYNNISQVYNEKYSDYPKALDYLLKAVEFNKQRDNLTSLTFNYGNISDAYLRMGDYSKAKTYAHLMLDASEQLNAPHRKVNAYAQLMRISKKMNQYDSALYFKEQNAWLSDSLNNIEKTAQIAEMQTRFETQEKEVQITDLSKKNKINNQRFWLAGGAALLLAILVGVFIAQNRRLQLQKKQIAAQSERLEWMMKELHHRVKNNLQIVSSLLSLQTYRLKDEESISALKESQLRVQAMSLIHQRLYQVEDVSMVNFKLYLDDLVTTLMSAYGYGSDDFDLCIEVETELLDVDTVMPMGLLVNEIITNSFKYAYKEVSRPQLIIQLQAGQQQLQLKIADNGPGMVTHTTTATKAGFGKKLVDALAKQLKAEYTISNDGGTSYLFTIPYQKEKAA